MGCPFPDQKLPLPVGDVDPMVPWVHPNPEPEQTTLLDRSVTEGRIDVRSTAMRPSEKWPTGKSKMSICQTTGLEAKPLVQLECHANAGSVASIHSWSASVNIQSL